MKVVIRTDASLKIGSGHVMRCLTLGKALQKQGAEVSFICREHEGNLNGIIEKSGFSVFALPTSDEAIPEESNTLFHSQWLGVSQKQDANQCQRILEDVKPEWLIVDHYALDKTWQEKLRPFFQKLMVIDDLGDRKHICDVLLDQNYGSSAEKYKGLVPEYCQLLLGTDFSLLRPEFAEWREHSLQRRQSPKLQTLLITMGGVDADNYTGQILQILARSKLPNELKQIIVIMGASAPHLEQVQQLSQNLSVDAVVKTNVSNMAEIMANADLAIGAAGATTWERCCLGLPTIQVVVAENQRAVAQFLARERVVKILSNIVDDIPSSLFVPTKELKSLSEMSRKVTDGLGVKKVVKMLGRIRWSLS